jgi:type IV pilus assembly protein PilO
MKFDINELDLNNFAEWPASARALAIGAFFCLILFLGYWFIIKSQLSQLQREKSNQVTLRQTFVQKQHSASNLEAYRHQMQVMQDSFGALLRQLPEETEVPGLLEDISYQGLASGLEFRSIRLQPEQRIDFYVELPIQISVMGGYHELGEFVSKVAGLPRIVTLHDLTIKPPGADSDQLDMQVVARTYRYRAGE